MTHSWDLLEYLFSELSASILWEDFCLTPTLKEFASVLTLTLESSWWRTRGPCSADWQHPPWRQSPERWLLASWTPVNSEPPPGLLTDSWQPPPELLASGTPVLLNSWPQELLASWTAGPMNSWPPEPLSSETPVFHEQLGSGTPGLLLHSWPPEPLAHQTPELLHSWRAKLLAP